MSTRATPDLLFFRRKGGLGRGELSKDQIVDGKPGEIAALDDVLGGGDGAGDDVNLDFEPHPAHAHGVLYAVLVVDDIFLRYHVDEVPVRGNGHRLGRVDGPRDVVLPHLFVPDRHHAVAVEALDVGPRDPRQAARDLDARHQLRLFQGLLYGIDRAVDVDDDPFAQARRRVGADACDVDLVVDDLGDHDAYLRAAHIEADEERPVLCHITPSSP